VTRVQVNKHDPDSGLGHGDGVQVEVFPLHGRLSNAVDGDQARIVLLNQQGEDAIDMACTGTPSVNAQALHESLTKIISLKFGFQHAM
jgi:hypothetical protein